MLGDASRRPKIGASAHNDKIQNFDGKMPGGAATLQKLKQNDEVHYPCRFLNLFLTQTSFQQAIMSSIQDLKSWLSKNETRKVRSRPQTLKTTGPMKWAQKELSDSQN